MFTTWAMAIVFKKGSHSMACVKLKPCKDDVTCKHAKEGTQRLICFVKKNNPLELHLYLIV